MIDWLKNMLKNRFVIFGLFLSAFTTVQWFFYGGLLPSTANQDLWFFSGIFMVLFSLLFIEPYYTSPKNVITNAIPLLLVFLAIKDDFIGNPSLWWAAVTLIVALLACAIVAIALENKNKSPEHIENRIATALKSVSVSIGRGRILYSAVFIYFLLANYSIQAPYTISFFLLWCLILAIDPKSISSTFSNSAKKRGTEQIGEVFGVQSRKIFLVKLYEDRKSIKKFDPVQFRYSMQDAADLTIMGIVFDTYLLDQEKWAKVLQLAEPKRGTKEFEKNVVYKITPTAKEALELKIERLVGVVIDGSTINKIKFEYSKKNDNLQEGDLIELKNGDRRLFYQVIAGVTEKEKLEARNESGFIEGEALQLGEWQNEKLSFQKFGWVPPINTPIFTADTSDIAVRTFTYPDYELGKIPSTNLPSVINLDEAISHHTALLGVTGSCKSFLAREIIRQITSDTKVICIDFNKEFVSTLTPPPGSIISDESAKEIAVKIDWINEESEKFGNLQDKPKIVRLQAEIKESLRTEIENFLNATGSNIRIFELPDVSNTTGILDYTKYFFKVLFEVAKARQLENNLAKICVVLEEAHTIIPEWNFSGSSDKASQSLVNSISQIALQGRKYGVGFLVIAQRTANVSKTVLTQCNTVVCFQAFDETSFTFLGNYVGKDLVLTLPSLKQYHAIVTGRAVRANLPMIVDLKRHES